MNFQVAVLGCGKIAKERTALYDIDTGVGIVLSCETAEKSQNSEAWIQESE